MHLHIYNLTRQFDHYLCFPMFHRTASPIQHSLQLYSQVISESGIHIDHRFLRIFSWSKETFPFKSQPRREEPPGLQRKDLRGDWRCRKSWT